MKLVTQSFSLLLLIFLLCFGCESKAEKENRGQEQKEKRLRTQKDSIKTASKIKAILSKYSNYKEFSAISLELFKKDFNQFRGKLYLVNSKDLAQRFTNYHYERENIYSKFWPSSAGINNGKYYAMFEDDPLTIFELNVPPNRLSEFEKELRNYNNFIFRIDKVNFFLDYYSETIQVYLSTSDGYEELSLEGDEEYVKEKMIYRKISGDLVELF